MKKLLSTIMALVMLLSLMPMAVAEEETAKWSETKTEKSVAQVGDMFYETLADAVASVPVDGTETTITLLNNAEVENYIAIKDGKNIVLDLNGHDVVHNGECLFDVYNAKFHVTGEGTLFENVKYGYAPIIARGSATDTADYTVITIDKGVTLKGDYTGIFVAKDAGNGYHNYGLVINMFGTIDMGAVADGYHYSGMYVNGTNTVSDGNVMTINLDGATIKNCAGAGIYAAGYAKWNITNSSITGGDTGIEIRAGELTLNDCALEATAEEFSCEPNGNGATTAGAAIAIAQHTTKKDIAVTINGGSFKGVKALNESNPQVNDPAPQVKLSIDGGTFIGDISTADVTGFIKGGTFTDLASAVKYATNGATITLAGDVSAERINLEDKSITVDLNGHTLTSTSAYGVMFCAKNGNTITVNGTTPGSKLVGTVMVTAGTDGHIVLNGGTYESDKYVPVYINGAVNTENSTLKIKDAVITAIGSSGGQDMGCAVYLAGYATSTIENTEITAPVTGIEIRAGKLDLTNCTVTGGNGKVAEVANGNGTTVTNAAVAVSQHTTKKNIDVTIKDGEYTATAALYQTDVQGTGSRGVKATVLSGMFTGEVKAATEGTITIKGGAFNVAPDAKYLAEGMIVVPGVKDAPYNVQPATREDENSKSEVKVDGDKVTTTVTDKATGTTTETVTDTTTGAETKTKTETKVEGNVTTKTETVTEKNAAGETTKVTESKIVENTENGKTETKTTVDGKTVKTDVTVNRAPATASDVTLNAKALEGKAAGTETSSVTVDKASLSELKNNTVKGVIIETDQATLKLDKAAVKTMESKVEDNDKMTLDITVTEEKNATTTEIEKVKVEVNAKNEAGQNVFPENTANTNGLINITIPYNGNATQLDLWYIAANGSATYMGRFPVVNGFVSFDVKHFSQYDLIPVASSGSGVIKTGAGSSAASTTQTVTTDLTPGSITKVTVDGKVVDAKYYTVSGSNVTFTAEFLKTLKNGSHTVTVENATKIAKGVFTVNNPTTAQSPTTADAGIALYAGMAIASVMGTGVVFTSRKRKNH
ncbi:MAG: hypothetical protein EGQ56_04815 [Clostridiales bacterium]|nr:hypothetical protein [Clostridiales bacterium]